MSEDSSISFSGGSSSRTIMASNLDSELDFWLEEVNVSGQRLSLTQITQISYSSSNKGYFSYSFQPRFYRLKMYAVKKNSGVAPQTILMQAKASVDLRANDEINFYLSQFTVQGDSYWSLSIYADGWNLSSSDYEKVSVGIYNKSNGNLESSTEIDYSSFNRDASTAEVNFAQTNASLPSLSAGTYCLKLIFTHKSSGLKYYYSDDIVLLANQTLNAKIAVPNIIQTVPSAPTRLRAGYNSSDTSSSFIYPVEFCWDDNSYNENYFELDLMDISDFCKWDSSAESLSKYNNRIKPLLFDYFSNGNLTITPASMNLLWDAVASSCTVTTYNIYSAPPAAGSFEAGSNFAVIKLHYGRTYVARLRSVNTAGQSDCAYLDLSLSDFSGNSGFTPTAWGTGASGLSRYFIKYILNDGIFYNASTDVSASVPLYSTLKSTNYAIQMRDSASYTEIAIPLNYEYESGRFASLKYKDTSSVYHEWEKWLSGGFAEFSDVTSGVSSKYSGCSNLYLYSAYADNASSSGYSYILRTSAITEAKDAHIVVSANTADDTQKTPFSDDTETENNPIYLSEALEVSGNYVNFVVSKSAYRYLNFMINTTLTGASAVSYTIYENGGSPARVVTKSPVGYIASGGGFADFIYCQIDLEATYGTITNFETGKVYCVNYEITQGNNIYKFSVKFAVNN